MLGAVIGCSYELPAPSILQAYRSTCLDRVDTNYKWFRETLTVVCSMLREQLDDPTQDADDEAPLPLSPDCLLWKPLKLPAPEDDGTEDREELKGEQPELEANCELDCPLLAEALRKQCGRVVRFTSSEWDTFGAGEVHSRNYIRVDATLYKPAPSLVEQLVQFSDLQLTGSMGNALVCNECLDTKCSRTECISGECLRCGFHRLWSDGLRKDIIQQSADGAEKISPNAWPLWNAEVGWDALAVGTNEGHVHDQDDLRKAMKGTVVEFLDAFEGVHRKWIPHRFHALQAKVAERELYENFTPHKLKDDSDWYPSRMCHHVTPPPPCHPRSFADHVSRSENGEIVVKEQMQSEYWHIKYYSLLISISSFLVTSKWDDRTSPLPAKAEVTVQRADVPANTTTYTKGSFFATVAIPSNEEGEDALVTVESADCTRLSVPRKQLRHRVWHRMAFLGITNEKQHVAITTQAFHKRQLDFWLLWHEVGRDAALAYASQDTASVPYSYMKDTNLNRYS